jgi:hypothetical protein
MINREKENKKTQENIKQLKRNTVTTKKKVQQIKMDKTKKKQKS